MSGDLKSSSCQIVVGHTSSGSSVGTVWLGWPYQLHWKSQTSPPGTEYAYDKAVSPGRGGGTSVLLHITIYT